MGLAAAATRLAKTMKSRDTAMKALNQRLRDGLKAFPEVELNSPENAVPEVLNFSEMCIKSETMLAWLAEAQVYVSSASACGRGSQPHAGGNGQRPACHRHGHPRVLLRRQHPGGCGCFPQPL